MLKTFEKLFVHSANHVLLCSLTVFILADVLVVECVLYVLPVLCVKINTGTRTTVQSDDLKKFVRRKQRLLYNASNIRDMHQRLCLSVHRRPKLKL